MPDSNTPPGLATPRRRPQLDGAPSAPAARLAAMERELELTRLALQGAVRSLDLSRDEQRAANDELTELNGRFQELLEQRRTASDDLQNVLYSTDVATLFLDADLNIKFFTPSTKALFKIIKTDIGRPLQDLHSIAADVMLPDDARSVLANLEPVEREIATASGVWSRRILPYRTRADAVQGVVITFTDITHQRHAAEALETAKREAELANATKSRFLAAASHDLRQPLQTLALLHGLLAKRVDGTIAERLVDRVGDTVGSMSGMLNTLLDINQIEAGVVRADIVDVRIDDLLARLKEAYIYQAQAQGVGLRVVPCGLTVRSDRRLLKQMLRNLLSNALKYTRSGKVLLGCRRVGAMLRIEVWDTGIGIPANELKAIFDEYHQLDNAAREPGPGLGLGLSIVRRLANLLEHRVSVRSRPGRGSVFSIEVPIAAGQAPAAREAGMHKAGVHKAGERKAGAAIVDAPVAKSADLLRHVPEPVHDAPRRLGLILIVEDDSGMRELLTLILEDEGYLTDAVPDGPSALAACARVRPDLVLSDFNLPNGMDGLGVTKKLREAVGAHLPVIILTGDISTRTLSDIAAERCLHLSKPVTPIELARAVQRLLPPDTAAAVHSGRVHPPEPQSETRTIFVVDDDHNIRDLVRAVLEDDGRTVQDFASGEAFLKAYSPGSEGCLLIDAYLPGMSGLEVLQHLRAGRDPLPAIMITGSSDVAMAVEAMKAGAADFIEKPIASAELLASIERALERSRDTSKLLAWQDSAAGHIADLTPRQHQIMDLVLAGHPSKNIAADLGISQRTVENHRASIMKTTGTKSLPALARLALAASRPLA